MERFMFAITAMGFSAIFLISLIVLGNEWVRIAALLSAFLGCVSQYAGAEPKSFKLSIYAAYGSFVCGAAALLIFAVY